MFASIQLIVNDFSLHLIDGHTHTHIYKTVFDIVKSLSLWLWNLLTFPNGDRNSSQMMHVCLLLLNRIQLGGGFKYFVYP